MRPEKDYTLKELQKELKANKLKTSGNKKDLYVRLKSFLDKNSRSVELEENQLDLGNSRETVEEDGVGVGSGENSDEQVDDEIGTTVEQNGNVNPRNTVANETSNSREQDMKLKEIELLKKEIELMKKEKRLLEMEKSETTKINVKDKDVAEFLNSFQGEDGDNFDIWCQQIKNIQCTYDISDDKMKVIVVNKIQGKAKKWFHSSADNIKLNLDELLGRLKVLFDNRPNRVILRKQLEARIWKYQENFTDYFQEKLCLANNLQLKEEELVDVVIEGMADLNLKNQARMQNFQTKENLLKAFSSVIKQKSSGSGQDRNERAQSGNKNSQAETAKKCSNCSRTNHTTAECRRPKRVPGSCFKCGEMGHIAANCPTKQRNTVELGTSGSSSISTNISTVQEVSVNDNYVVSCSIFLELQQGEPEEIKCHALIDTGSPVSIIKQKLVSDNFEKNVESIPNYVGINGTALKALGTFGGNILIFGEKKFIKLVVAENSTTVYDIIIGRDFLNKINARLVFFPKSEINYEENDIMNINVIEENEPELIFDENIHYKMKEKILNLYKNYTRRLELIENPDIQYEMKITLENEQKFNTKPRRLSYHERDALNKILNDLQERKIIRPSDSEYSSAIVMVKKKNKDEYRLCVDYRSLNKYTQKDNYPLPIVEDLINQLGGKQYFTLLDLKSGFHHVKMSEDSVRFTSFVTPLGQFEYTKMPFGLKNAPSVFQRFVELIFKPFIKTGEVVIYIDDVLIASDTLEQHVSLIERIFNTLADNCLELNVSKCKFFFSEIDYLGYTVGRMGVKPNRNNVTAISNYPVPKNLKEVQRFLGMCSYFRKFIEGFCFIAQPLQDLVKKNVPFVFGPGQFSAFCQLKQHLLERPVLGIFDPNQETELHCDGSAVGYGSILMQRGKDGKFHPIFFFSKRTTESESKYHSYEIETMAIIYALRRFRIYLLGRRFKIITDCNALTLTLRKQIINPRISRWALEMQSYDYVIEHRAGKRMCHVDALSRCQSVLVLEENSFEQTLALCQSLDTDLEELRQELEHKEHSLYELRDGLIYRKVGKGKIRFYVPKGMQMQILKTSHDQMGHLGVEKTLEVIRRVYWFPNLTQRVKDYIQNCPKCISFNVAAGKGEGFLHSIPKGNKPFHTIHIDYYGPLESPKNQKKYILVVIDGFSKFVKLFATKAQTTEETIKCLDNYFNQYSRPLRLVSDRGTCFTSAKFKEYLKEQNVQQILVASGCPRANGQVERVNRTLGPMISKLVNSEKGLYWDKTLSQVEFSLNNTKCRSTGITPSKLMFGVNQKGEVVDKIKEYLEENLLESDEDELTDLRAVAEENILKSQKYNEKLYNNRHKPAKQYNQGDLVMITNVDTTVGVNKKLIPKYRGPYMVNAVLGNDRYHLKDVEGFQITQKAFDGIFDAGRMRPWIAQPSEL